MCYDHEIPEDLSFGKGVRRKYLRAVMGEPIPEWFWAFFMFVLLVLIGVAYQLHRIEAKINAVWKYLTGPDESGLR